MPQKSHRVASRQAEASKKRKQKKKSQASPRRDPAAQVNPDSAYASQPSAVPRPPAKPSAPQAIPRYQYVAAELRKIAIIAGAMIAVLVVLAFVLG